MCDKSPAKPPQWTLTLQNTKGTIEVARYITSLRINPIAAVEALCATDRLELDHDYTLVPGTRPNEITHLNWETRHAPDYISAPVLLYHILVSSENIILHMNYVWSIESRSPLNVVQAAIPIVAGWFRDIMHNPPIVDSALRFGRSTVQMIVAAAAHHLRMVCPDLQRRTEMVDRAISGPWRVSIATTFYKMMHRCILEAPVPIEVVAINGPKDPTPDVVVDNLVGYVFAPAERVADRVVVLLLLLFADRYDLLGTWCTSDARYRKTAGVPAQIRDFLDVFRSADATHPVLPPPHTEAPEELEGPHDFE